LADLLAAAIRLGFDGLNVTHPVKQAMVPLVDEVTDDVAAIGALNTILVRGGRTVGHNTDVTGFERAFREGMPGAATDKVVLLGAGGAGTAVAHALAHVGARHIVAVDPDVDRRDRLVRSVSGLARPAYLEGISPEALAPALEEADGLVNATPIGMAAHPGCPLDVGLLRGDLWVVDIVYRPLVTELLGAARRQGCRTLSGAGMAVHQAADAFELITGREADRRALAADFDQMVAAEVPPAGTPPETALESTDERKQ
jgi:shikimate dehydrogenase